MKRENLINSFLAVAFAAGLLFQFGIVVRAAPGDLDLTFGIGGKITTSTGYAEKGNAVAIQADGKIVVAGARDTSIGKSLLVRYNPDGSLDQSFGIGGIVISSGAGGGSDYKAVAIQTDGKIVTAGFYYENGGCSRYQSSVARYNADGSLDTTFGNGDGMTAYPYLYVNGCPVDSYNYGLAIQNNGKIVVAGASKNGSSNLDFAAARFNTDGTPDTSFNLDGLATFPIGSGNEAAYSIAVNPTSGKIVLAGYISNTPTSNDFALIMLNSAGLYDWNFGGTGKVTTNTGGQDFAQSVVFQSDGKIIAAGRQSNGSNGTDFSLARYNTNGTLDTSFGTGGKVVTAFSASYDAAFGIALQSNGKAVVAGFGADNNALYTGYNFALSRYDTNGSLDTSFSGDGKQMTDFINYEDHGQAVAIQADGKIVVAGYTYNGNDYDIALARYLP